MVTIDAYKKEIQKDFSWVRKLNSSLPQWIGKTETYKVWIYQSVGKLKGLGHQEKQKMKDLSIHTWNIYNTRHSFKVILRMTIRILIPIYGKMLFTWTWPIKYGEIEEIPHGALI